MNAPALRDYMAAHGHAAADWPVKQWGLTELTLLAFYYHPELAVARAQANAALAEAGLAGQGGPIKVTPLIQHHSKRVDGNDSPWSLGFDVEIPIASGTRRAVIAERAGYLAESAELNVGSVAWQVRSQVRSHLLDLYAARSTASSLTTEVQARNTLVALIERRLEAGSVSATELSAARIKLSEARGRLAAATTSEQQASGQLAAAVGVAPEVLRGQKLSFSEFATVPDAPQGAQAQREALTNRLDLRRALLDYAAADAAVKLAVAKQYPDVTLRPGYLWDQGYGVWSVAVDLLFPAGSVPGIRAAEAQREVAARQAIGHQASIITGVQTALAAYEQAAAGAQAATQTGLIQIARNVQMQKQFDAGYADRFEVTQSNLEAAGIERNALAAQIETQRVLGQLEDALQRPLSGGPLPAFATGYDMADPAAQASAAR